MEELEGEGEEKMKNEGRGWVEKENWNKRKWRTE